MSDATVYDQSFVDLEAALLDFQVSKLANVLPLALPADSDNHHVDVCVQTGIRTPATASSSLWLVGKHWQERVREAQVCSVLV